MDSISQQVNKGNILVVDDSLEHLQAISATLSESGYTVRAVMTGSTVVMVAQLALPDLILLDIKMSDIDGYEICKQLKADEATCDIPVIFLSALYDVFDKVKAFKVGGVDYITKPFQVEEVLARVENQLTIQRLSRQLKEQNQKLQQEITERRQAEAAAAAASQAKSNFLANMSHELRTPLNAILGFTEIMERDLSLNADIQENIKIIHRSGEYLLELINDILELSKIEEGRTCLNESTFDLYCLLDNIEEMFQLKASQNKNNLIFHVCPHVPQYIKTDKKKLRCCLINLLSNAIKFTQNGIVTLRVSVGNWELGIGNPEKSNAQCPMSNAQFPIPYSLFFEIEDTGCGIAPNEIDKLFDAFVQAEAGKVFAEGTGLGLTITRSFVEMMGGNITVESVLGKGSIFKFHIKIAVVDASGVITQPQQRVIGLELGQPVYRILVVDDTPENAKLLVKLLQPVGFEVRTVGNGKEAIALWETWQPHLIWMDTRMPIMDGLAATREIRRRERASGNGQGASGNGQGASGIGQGAMGNGQGAMGNGQEKNHYSMPNSQFPMPNAQFPMPNSPTFIIALTTSTSIETQRQIFTTGYDDLVCKPFTEEKIFAKMAEYLKVSYIYEQLPTANNANTKLSPINPTTNSFLLEQLALMSSNWLLDLHHAANEVDEELINKLLQEIPKNYVGLLETLQSLVKDFRFDIIVNLTGKIINT